MLNLFLSLSEEEADFCVQALKPDGNLSLQCNDSLREFIFYPESKTELVSWLETHPANVIVLARNAGEVFTFEYFIQTLKQRFNPDDKFVSPNDQPLTFKERHQLYNLELLNFYTSGPVEWPKRFSMDALIELCISDKTALEEYFASHPLPDYFTLEPDEKNPPLESASLITKDGNYPPGVFLMPKRLGWLTFASCDFQGQLLTKFAERFDLLKDREMFMAFDSAVVPANMFDGSSAAFTSSSAVPQTMEFLKIFIDNLAPEGSPFFKYSNEFWFMVPEAHLTEQGLTLKETARLVASIHQALN